MVGGVVDQVLILEDRVWILVHRPDRVEETCGVEVERTPASEVIEKYDYIWWQGNRAFWTPYSRAFKDYRLNRVTLGNCPRPREAEVVAVNE